MGLILAHNLKEYSQSIVAEKIWCNDDENGWSYFVHNQEAGRKKCSFLPYLLPLFQFRTPARGMMTSTFSVAHSFLVKIVCKCPYTHRRATSQAPLSAAASRAAMDHHHLLVYCIQSIKLFQGLFLLDYQHFDINSLTSVTYEPLTVTELFLFLILSLLFIFLVCQDLTHFAFLKKCQILL